MVSLSRALIFCWREVARFAYLTTLLTTLVYREATRADLLPGRISAQSSNLLCGAEAPDPPGGCLYPWSLGIRPSSKTAGFRTTI